MLVRVAGGSGCATLVPAGQKVKWKEGAVQRRLYSGAWMLLAALTVIGCTGSGDAAEAGRSASPSPPSDRIALEEPCPDGVTLGLGAPFRGRDYAKFQTTGGTVYISVRHVSAGEADDPEAGQSTIYVGALARPPAYDPQSGRVRRTIVTTSVLGSTWSAIDLPEGRYWLTASNGWDVLIRSCEPGGVSDAATRYDVAPRST